MMIFWVGARVCVLLSRVCGCRDGVLVCVCVLWCVKYIDLEEERRVAHGLGQLDVDHDCQAAFVGVPPK